MLQEAWCLPEPQGNSGLPPASQGSVLSVQARVDQEQGDTRARQGPGCISPPSTASAWQLRCPPQRALPQCRRAQRAPGRFLQLTLGG